MEKRYVLLKIRLHFHISSHVVICKKSVQDWSFEESDLAAIQITFTNKHIPTKGPGIAKVNTNIFNNPIIYPKIEFQGNE